MAKKCVLCGKVKGKRGCKIHNNDLICPKCCADVRGNDCQGCGYYKDSKKYMAQKSQKHFLVELNEEVEKTVDKAMILVEKKRFNEAEPILNDLMREHPRNHMAAYGMGTLRAMQGKSDDAIRYFQEAVDIFPYFMEAYYNMGVAYMNKFDASNMIKSMRKVVELGDAGDMQVMEAKSIIRDMEKSAREVNGVDLETYINAQDEFDRAFDLMQSQAWEDAAKGFKESIRLVGQMAQAHGNLGICYAKLGKKSEALAAFDRAIEIDPNYEPALLHKEMVKTLEEGEALGAETRTIEYYKDYPLKNKSYIEDYIKNAIK